MKRKILSLVLSYSVLMGASLVYNDYKMKELDSIEADVDEIKIEEKKDKPSKEEDEIHEEENNKSKGSTLKDICAVIIGIIALKFGGDLAVDNAVKVATILGLSEKIISVTILAIGTSLPELVTSVSAALIALVLSTAKVINNI